MEKLTMRLRKGVNWQFLISSSFSYVASVWGEAEVKGEEDGKYFVIIRDERGTVAFFHVIAEIKWED